MAEETSKEKVEVAQMPFNRVDIWKVASVIGWDCYEVNTRIKQKPFSSYELSPVGFRHKFEVTFIPGANRLRLHVPKVGIFSSEYTNLQTVEIDERQEMVRINSSDTRLSISKNQILVQTGKFKLTVDFETGNSQVGIN